MPEVVIALDAVSRAFPSGGEAVNAVRDVSLAIEAGSAAAITGPSGSGKTTLLNLMAGLDRPTSGSVTVLGRRLDKLAERELTALRASSIGLVFQDPHLLAGLSALENVVVAQLPWGRRRDLERDAQELLEAVGLGARLAHPASRLSGGERQRVGVARALLGGRRLLLADEPTGHLDAGSTEDLVRLLDRLWRELGLTLVIATHDPAVAALAGRVIRLAGGAVESDRSLPLSAALDRHSLD